MAGYARRLLIVLLPFTFLWNAPAAQAGAPCSDFSSDRIVNTIQLSPEIPRQQSQGTGEIFYEQRMLVVFEPGYGVLLAGSADGQAEIVTDDILEIKVKDTGQSWTHDFRTPDHQAIVPLPPQDITHLFSEVPGVSLAAIQVQAQDLLGPEYRASELWLIVWQMCTPTATSTATLLPSTPTPILTHTWTPEPTATPVPPLIDADPAEPASPLPWRMMLGSSLLFLGGVGFLFWQMMARARRPHGLVEIYQAESGEFVARYVLQQLRKAVLTVGPQGDIWLPERADSTPVARIYTQRDGGDRVTMLDLLSEADPTIVLQTIEAYDGLRVTFSPYVLIYQQVEETSRTIIEQEHNYV